MISGISSTSSYYSYLSQLRQYGTQSSSSDEIFGKIDTDGNGKVSKDEFNTFRSNMEAQIMGSVMASQFDTTTGIATATDDLFSKIDTDGDGSVSTDEFSVFSSKMQSQAGNGMQGPMGPPPGISSDDLFSKIDTDGDGSVSEDEFNTFRTQMEAQAADAAAQGLGGTVSSSTGAAAGSSTTAEEQGATSSIASLIMDAISKYLVFAQQDYSSASTNSVNVAG
jgi:Ca2+-binding EF-hand superfamily protein